MSNRVWFFLQGSRTIIDNLDTGREVIPILTRYEGFFDCLFSIRSEEGISGLFKGFGAVVLQYTVHFLVIRFSASIIKEIVAFFDQDNPPAALISQLEEQQQELQRSPSVPGGAAAAAKLSPVGSVKSLNNFPQDPRVAGDVSGASSVPLQRKFDQDTPTSSLSNEEIGRRKIFPDQ